MHEFTIVQSMLELCEKYAGDKEVDSVIVNIGKMSGIEPHFLEESFDVFKENTICRHALLKINLIDITIVCNRCNIESVVEDYNFYCPKCKSGDTKLLTGQEMHIEYLELKDKV